MYRCVVGKSRMSCCDQNPGAPVVFFLPFFLICSIFLLATARATYRLWPYNEQYASNSRSFSFFYGPHIVRIGGISCTGAACLSTTATTGAYQSKKMFWRPYERECTKVVCMANACTLTPYPQHHSIKVSSTRRPVSYIYRCKVGVSWGRGAHTTFLGWPSYLCIPLFASCACKKPMKCISQPWGLLCRHWSLLLRY